VAKRWSTPAVTLIPTTLVGIAAAVWSVSTVNAPCSEGALCGLAVLAYPVAAVVYLASWPVCLLLVWLLRKAIAAGVRHADPG
jgi:hypothetical protein